MNNIMRKIIITLASLLLLGLLPGTARAQEGVLTSGPLNEVKLNLPITIAGKGVDLSCERILLEDLSAGAAVTYVFNQTYALPYQYAVTPYARWFFWKRRGQEDHPGAGFFLEVSMGLFGGNVVESHWVDPEDGDGKPVYTSEEKNGFGVGPGLAVGHKWISRNGFVGEIYVGAGRNFVGPTEQLLPAFFRSGIALGYRF